MSCDECDRLQKIAFDKKIPDSINIFYIRIGISNMAIVGCPEHVKELIDKLRGENGA